MNDCQSANWFVYVQNRSIAFNNAQVGTGAKAAADNVPISRAGDSHPRITIIKASSVASASHSESSQDVEMSSGTGTASGDSSSSSQLSPPALERIERPGGHQEKATAVAAAAAAGDDGVLIPSKPLPQWGVCVISLCSVESLFTL